MRKSDGSRTGVRRSDFLRGVASTGIAAGLVGTPMTADAQDAPPTPPTGAQPKPATAHTKKINGLYRQRLPFDNTKDFEDAHRA